MNLLARVSDVTGWPDQDIGDMVGLSRVTVNRAIHGHVNTRIGVMQTKELRDAMAEMISELQKLVDYIDITS